MSNIPGYNKGSGELPPSEVSIGAFEQMCEAALFDEKDIEALRRSRAILEPQLNEILDVWYGFVGSKSFLLAQFADPETREPDGRYLERVRARFKRWVVDTAEANYDDEWLRWQAEIGRRHHRTGKNVTDQAQSTALIPFRYLLPLLEPIVATLRPFLEAGGHSVEVVDAMHAAWRKSVLLQVTLWSFPYIIEGDF